MNNPDEIVEKFNKQFPAGSTVNWRKNTALPFRAYTVQFAAANHDGKPVCWLKERTGMVSIEPDFIDYEEVYA